MEPLFGEVEEIVQGASFSEENKEYDLFIFKLKDGKYILYYNIFDNQSNNILFSIMKEFDDVEMAKKEFEFYNFEQEKEGN